MYSYAPNWSEEVKVISKVKNTIYLLVISKAKKLLECFTEKKLQKTNQKEFLTLENVIKRESYKLYVKWKSCYNSFNSQFDKKDII